MNYLYRQVFISSAVYEMQNPMCRVHLVAMHEYMSRTGNMAAIYERERDRESLVFVFGNGSLYQKTFEQGARTSRYIKAQPNNVMDRKIGEATLNIFSLRCWYMYATKTMVPNAQKIETASNVILDRLRSNAK